MKRRIPRARRPAAERVEGRALLSSIYTDLLYSRPPGHRPLAVHAARAGTGGGTGGPLTVPAPAIGQGPQSMNYALAPTGVPTSREVRREKFTAVYSGPYTIGVGRFDTEALNIHIRGVGRANTMLHSDLNMRIIVPKDTSLPAAGVLSIFDRNLNSNTVLGFDFNQGSRPIDVDKQGRPNHFPTVAVDVNQSAGTYVQAISQGTIDVRYHPVGPQKGLLGRGVATVTIHTFVYTAQVNYILTNSDINP